MIKKPTIYLVRLKPEAKLTPNHYGHRYFHSKMELKTWMKDNANLVHDISLANWEQVDDFNSCLLYTSPSPRDATLSRMPSSA